MMKMKKSAKIWIAVSIALVMLALILLLIFNGRIYYGISAGGVDIGGRTRAEAEQILDSTDFFANMPQFECNGVTFSAAADELGISWDSKATAERAYQYGRGGNVLNRIAGIYRLMFTPADIPIEIEIDEAKLNAVLDNYIKDLRTPATEPLSRLEGDKIFITNGREGVDVSIAKLEKDLSDFIYNKEEKIVLTLEMTNPTTLTAEELRNKFATLPVDATYSVSNLRISYTSSKNGVEFDVREADRILKDNADNLNEYFIPVTIIPPEHTIESLDKSLFGDCLGTYTSKYNPAEKGRTKNVTLAASKINNIVLGKGDVFSYNAIVGERTAKRGFTPAKVYSGGVVAEGLGGGVCQVSSTLYNAVLYADLEVISRTGHSLPVTYVPLGRDATVSYGDIDFRFSNPNGSYVRITSSVGGGVLTVSVWGRRVEDKKVEIRTERVSTIPFSVKEEEDTTIPYGEHKVKQTGRDGAEVNTYKTVIENGKAVYTKLLHRSTYNPIDQINLVHPKPPPDEPLTSAN